MRVIPKPGLLDVSGSSRSWIMLACCSSCSKVNCQLILSWKTMAENIFFTIRIIWNYLHLIRPCQRKYCNAVRRQTARPALVPHLGFLECPNWMLEETCNENINLVFFFLSNFTSISFNLSTHQLHLHRINFCPWYTNFAIFRVSIRSLPLGSNRVPICFLVKSVVIINYNKF